MPPSRSFLTILLRRKWIILEIAGTVFLIAVAVALLQPRIYEATVWMLMTSGGKQGSSTADQVATQADVWSQLQNDLSMHIRLIRRAEMAEQVTRKLNLDLEPRQLLGAISVAKVAGAEANLIALNFRAADPKRAQQVVNAWADAYENDSFARSSSSTTSAIDYVQKQIATIEEQLRGFEQRIAVIEQENLTAGIGAGGGAAASALSDLMSTLMSNQTELASVQAQIARTQQQVATEPPRVEEVEEHPTHAATAAEEELAQLHVKLQQLRLDYYEDSPEITALKQQIDALEKQLADSSGMTRAVVKSAPNPTQVKAKDSLVALQAQLRGLQARDRTLRQQIAEQRAVAVAVPPTNIQYTELKRKVTALEQVHGTLLSRLYELQLQKAMALPPVQLVKAAELPLTPVEPRMETIIGLGFLIGVLLAIVSAVVIDQLDDTFANLNEIDETVPHRLLGAIPRFENATQETLPILDRPRAPFANAMRMLASAIRIDMERNRIRSLVVTSAGRSEGKSVISANLATSLAKAGSKVILVDADLHKPAQHRTFGLSNDVGLSNLLVGKSSLAEVLQPTRVDNLLLIASGAIPPSPVDLLASEVGEEAIQEINRQADIVVWDTPPAAILADATVIGSAADCCLFVIGHKAKRGMVRDTLRNLQDVGIRIVGAAANQVRPAGGSYYYYYYYYPYTADARKTE